ncbi:cell filamentation protein Fic [archaeon]|nr:cell filamentation protein Fic [archaeon]|tara:strand:+ start:1679 stop:2617 length:939 start_codon:yes stop_codon:yes gene_type:complete
MYLEIREIGKKKKYYLTHSYKKEGKVQKTRRYLGENLSNKQLLKIRPQAEKAIKVKINESKRINNPFNTVLSIEEIKEIDNLISKNYVKIQHLSKKQWNEFTESFTYNTNAIEGSTLILSEVKKIISNNIWPQDAPKEDIAEAQGVKSAIDYIRTCKTQLSIKIIKEIHEIIFQNSKSFAGKIRKKGVEVVIRDFKGEIVHQGAPSILVSSLLKELVTWYQRNKNKYHPIVLAAVVHNQFETIHPFADGNGRVGRVLLNNILIKHDFPPINIEFKHRREYYRSLQEYQKRGDLRPTIELFLKEYKILKRKFR